LLISASCSLGTLTSTLIQLPIVACKSKNRHWVGKFLKHLGYLNRMLPIVLVIALLRSANNSEFIC
jgi:hypothetical protein